MVVPAERDVLFGLSRMYELLREGSPELGRGFRDIGEAGQWLAQS